MSLREELFQALVGSRAVTLSLTEDVDDEGLRAQPDPGLSPIGWHLGHVTWTEETWTLGAPGPDAQLWSSFVSQKSERAGQLPSGQRLRARASQVRARTLDKLEKVDLDDPLQRWIFRFVANHERQHAETMAAARIAGGLWLPAPAAETSEATSGDFLAIPGGSFLLGSDDDPEGWDNERRAHEVAVSPFELCRRPVTCGEWEGFVKEGGYQNRALWSEVGWAFSRGQGLRAPLGWEGEPGSFTRRTLAGIREVTASHPVSHVSLHEAEAFARFASARLPTEFEWERAASLDPAGKRRYPSGAHPADANLGAAVRDTTPAGARPASRSALGLDDLCGNVWEWTSSAFAPYPGFVSDPYDGYSVPWFDGRHRVLRGGCHLTQAPIARAAFRNWFEPHVRSFPTGVRLARSS